MAFASKTPLPILFLLAGCVIFAKQLFFEVSHPGDEGTQRRNPVIELATLGVLLFAMGIVLMGANEIKIEIRYLLPLFPLLYILVAGFLAGLRGRQAVRVPTLGLG